MMGIFLAILAGLGLLGIVALIIADAVSAWRIHDPELWKTREKEARQAGKPWPPPKGSSLYEDYQEFQGWYAEAQRRGIAD